MPIHQACRAHLTGYVHSPEYQDIICGVKLAPSARDLGSFDPLIHVSEGANLAFLELLLQRIMKRWRWSEAFIVPAVLLFTAAHGCSPATVRVTVSILLRSLIRRWQLRWTASERLMTAGLAALIFCRSLAQVQGLMVSWIASLIIHVARPTNRGFSGRLLLQIRFYLLLFPALMPYEISHPLSIVGWTLFYPFIGFGLFLCALTVFICPGLAGAIDALLDLASRAFKELAAFLPPPWPGQAIPLTVLALYLLALSAWCRRREAPASVHESIA